MGADDDGAGVAGGEGFGVAGGEGFGAAGGGAAGGGAAGEPPLRRRPRRRGAGAGTAGWRGREPGDPRRWYGPEVEEAILARVAAGETLAGVCGGDGMPSLNTALSWVKGARPAFAARLDAARREAGRPWEAPKTQFCAATFGAILERLCDGEGMVAICADPAMPNVRTVYRWLAERADLRDAVELARQVQGDGIGELALREAMTATPATARLAEVRLRHLRWWAAKLAPVRYGTHKAEAAPKPAGAPEDAEEAPVFVPRSFWVETREDGWRRMRASYPSPSQGRIVDEPPGAWGPPPIGWQNRQPSQRPVGATEAGVGAGAARPHDPEGWT